MKTKAKCACMCAFGLKKTHRPAASLWQKEETVMWPGCHVLKSPDLTLILAEGCKPLPRDGRTETSRTQQKRKKIRQRAGSLQIQTLQPLLEGHKKWLKVRGDRTILDIVFVLFKYILPFKLRVKLTEYSTFLSAPSIPVKDVQRLVP